jgi:hypothetical protein
MTGVKDVESVDSQSYHTSVEDVYRKTWINITPKVNIYQRTKINLGGNDPALPPIGEFGSMIDRTRQDYHMSLNLNKWYENIYRIKRLCWGWDHRSLSSYEDTVLLRPSVHGVWHVTLVNTIWHSSQAKFWPWQVPKAVPFVLNRQFSRQIRRKSILSSVHSGLWPVTKHLKYLIHGSLWSVTEHSVVIVQYSHTLGGRLDGSRMGLSVKNRTKNSVAQIT